ncbi:hypothetical protein SAMD00019534_126200, partial [Acytostelium subglobosum LB1]|uniref:hypothetical protein n=1 Tax=Acytostelium subglobosum LB1 TaxID=1410327 RepID=UPI000644E5DD
IPQSITQLSLDHHNESLQAGHIPQSVTQLSFGDFNQPLHVGHIPQSVTHLSFCGFDQPLQVGHIPQSVTHLSLAAFNQPLQVGHIPQSVTHLSLAAFNQPLQVGHIPHFVTQLSFDDFNQPLQVGHIPQSVTQLSFLLFYQPLQVGHIPQSVTQLSFAVFDQPLQVEHIPQSVTQLSLDRFNQPLQVGHIPQSVAELSLSKYSRPLQVGHIPQSVTQLSFSLFNQPLQVGHIPKHVKHLTFGGCFDQHLTTEYIPSVTSLSIYSTVFSPKNFSLHDHKCLNELTVIHCVGPSIPPKHWRDQDRAPPSFLDHNTDSIVRMYGLSHLIIKVMPNYTISKMDECVPPSLLRLLKSITTITLQIFPPNGFSIVNHDFETTWRLSDDETGLFLTSTRSGCDGGNGVVSFWKFLEACADTAKPQAKVHHTHSAKLSSKPRITKYPSAATDHEAVTKLREFMDGKTISQMSRLTKDKLSQYLTTMGIPTTSDTKATKLKLARELSKALNGK